MKIDGVENRLTQKINGVEERLSESINALRKTLEHSDKARNLWLAVLTLVVTVAAVVVPYLK